MRYNTNNLSTYFSMLHNRFDFSTCLSTWFVVAVIPLSVLVVMYAPDSWGYENGILENLQMILLMLCLIFCITAKADKSLYLFFATVVLFLMLREVNCGRVLFWSRPGEIFHCGPVDDYLKWKEIPHGSIIRTCVYAVASLLCLLALCRKGNLAALINLVWRTRIPFWELILLISGISTGMIAEKLHICFLAEEMGEMLMYTALTSAIYRYTRSLQPKITA